MRVLFLEIETEGSWALASIGPAFLAAFLRPRGHEVTLLRVPYETPEEEVADQVKSLKPQVVALSLTTRQWLRARSVVEAVRRVLHVPVLAGGLHPTFSARDVLASGFDYVCLGEGEEAMAELLWHLENGTPRHEVKVPNIWARGGPQPDIRPPLEPLDDLPFLARDLLEERHGVIHMTTQRGCPFPCTYCAARNYNQLYQGLGTYGRRRSHENVLQELLEIRRAGELNYVIFLDDTFTLDRPWVETFCHLYGETLAVPFTLHARVETVDRGLLECLAAAGCRHITYGVESGSERVRREVLRRPVENRRFEEVFAWTRELGILVTANYMLGIPGETRADLEATVALHRSLDPDDFGYFVFYPYPGTPLYRVCVEEGYLPANHRDLEANHRQSILRLPNLTSRDVDEFYRRFTSLREERHLRRSGSSLRSRQAITTEVQTTAARG